MFCLADGNNFYVSCERIFRPELRGVPVAVLSNNDGACVSRSYEAKKLGVPMGAPAHELRDFVVHHGLILCSSNYSLYGDISDRFMRTLKPFAGSMFCYSIDEAFLCLDGVRGDLHQLGLQIKAKVLQDVGIPIGIGIAPTKVLAKLANWAAKKWPATGGVVVLTDPARQAKLLQLAEVGEVWGIGRQLTSHLQDMGIRTAAHLAAHDPKALRQRFSINVERTARELRGEVCFSLHENPGPKKMIACTRSFGQRLYSLPDLQQAIASHIARASEKLRAQQEDCRVVQVFIRTSPFDSKGESYSRSTFVQLQTPSSDVRDLLQAAQAGLASIYRPGPAYAKAGVILMEFINPRMSTPDLFAPPPRKGSADLMAVIDKINRKQGRGTIKPARLASAHSFAMKQDRKSPCFTTSWSDLLKVGSGPCFPVNTSADSWDGPEVRYPERYR